MFSSFMFSSLLKFFLKHVKFRVEKLDGAKARITIWFREHVVFNETIDLS